MRRDDPEYMKHYMRKYYSTEEGKKNVQKAVKKYYKEAWIKIIDHYTNGLRMCQCPGCDIDILEFLTIDHKNNDGAKHRKFISAHKMYQDIIKNNFPKNYQILCMNCNWAKRVSGICPHLKK